MSEEHTDMARVLGRIEGQLDMIVTSQHVQSERLDAMGNRVRKVETQAAKAGALTEADVADTLKALDYAPSTPVEDGVGHFVDWYCNFYREN